MIMNFVYLQLCPNMDIGMDIVHADDPLWCLKGYHYKGGCALCQAQEKTEAVLVSVVTAELDTTNNHAQ